MVSKIKRISAFVLCAVMLFALPSCGKKEKKDVLSGNKWQTSSGMLLDLNKDGTFKWYNNKAERNDNYYSGEYTIKSGQEAIDFIEEDQGFPEDSQRSVMARYSVSDDCYYSIVFNNKECIRGGENILEEENSIVYYGYYDPDYESLNIYGLNSMTPYVFTKM